MNKRLWFSILLGAFLGIFCIIGVGWRVGYQGNELFLLATWYNRVIMGLVIGLAASIKLTKSKANSFFRGALLGLLISFAWYFSTDFRDAMGFLAGIAYGIIIDMSVTYYLKRNKHNK